MAKFICQNCNYEFYPKDKNKNTPPKRCPYCGEDNKVEVKKHILEDL